MTAITKSIFITVILSICAAWASAQTTEFTYQGKLTSGGSPASGNHDFEFALFDALSGGVQVGSTITANNVLVTEGTFSVKLNFGAQFPGAARFLEIRVRQSGGGTFTPLLPRQQIGSTPYSIKSLTAETAANATSATSAANAVTAANALQLGGLSSSQYVVTGDPRLSDARSPLAGSANYVQNTTNPQASSNFNISGNGTAAGTLSGNVVNAATQFDLNGQRAVFANADQSLAVGILAGANGTGGSNSFFGYRAGESNSTGIGNSFFGSQSGAGNTTAGGNTYFGMWAGRENRTGTNNAFFGIQSGLNNTGSSNSFFGATSGTSNTTGAANTFAGNASGGQHTTGSFNTFFGSGAGNASTIGSFNTFVGGAADFSANNISGGSNTLMGYGTKVTSAISNGTAIGANAAVTQSNTLILGGITGTNGGTSVNVGIGTTNPGERLHVVGNGLFTGSLTVNGTLTANLPSGNANYIQNTTTQQPSSNFDISGNGTAAGTLSAQVVNATTQYNLGTLPIIRQTGVANLFVGWGTGNSTTGSSNAFFGFSAGNATTSGSSNSFFGSNAAHVNTTGSNNSFFGEAAGLANINGNLNSFFGQSAGIRSISGGSNAFFGSSSGTENTTGSRNSFFGIIAGNLNTTGNNNTVVGYDADVSLGDLNFATAIGSGSVVSSSNTVVLGRSLDAVQIPGSMRVSGAVQIAANGGNVILGNPGCNPGFAAIGFAPTLSGCSNYSLLGDGTNTIISRPVGGVIEFRQGNTTQASIDANGLFSIVTLGTGGVTSLCKNGSSQISVCSSSLRYKTNIDTFRSGFDLIKKLRPISFNWKDSGMHDVGLGAEDVAAVEPLLVTYNEDGQVEGVKYDRIGVVLINAVKEQQRQLDEQEAENRRLKAELDALKAFICSKENVAAFCGQGNRKP